MKLPGFIISLLVIMHISLLFKTKGADVMFTIELFLLVISVILFIGQIMQVVEVPKDKQ